ncbi:Aste57867_19536 [Aphanomyces stellatus]|uniref:Aste57867_19536 protein n=1 Tax=Aphanomyces stellatus TaxID=120398 RepID=A0A485LHF5_9STRA|nr:hypothetical protein As57867_019472 [Aphanomyces stellatus]VFT96243.1 Aste57867_19536 [Aphanomyces stellatus]
MATQQSSGKLKTTVPMASVLHRLSGIAKTMHNVNHIKSNLKSRVKRRAGWSRKQALSDDITRHCKYHMEHLGCLPPLSIEIKLESIKKAVKKNLTFKAEWTSFYWNKFFFRSSLVVRMITDLFWWASLDFFTREDDDGVSTASYTHEIKAFVQDQVAVNYAKLLTKVLYMTLPTGAADEFLDYFPYCLSRTVYKAMQKIYPEFLTLLRLSCSQPMIETIALWTTGVVPKSVTWNNWRHEVEKRKLRHGPKPTMVVREALDEFDIPEEVPSDDDSNDADYLSDDDAARSHFVADIDEDGDVEGPPIMSMLDSLDPPALPPPRSKVSLQFSPSVDKIMHLYKYTGCQGRKLGYTMTVSDPTLSAVDQHIRQHEKYLDQLEKTDMRASRSAGALGVSALLILDKVKGCSDVESKVPLCEFELKNPVAEARERRLAEAKNRQREHDQEYVGEIIQYKPATLALGQRLDQQVKLGSHRRRVVLAALQPLKNEPKG